jgi:hypothetical protein
MYYILSASTLDVDVGYITNNHNYKIIGWAGLQYACELLIVTFFLWVNYIIFGIIFKIHKSHNDVSLSAYSMSQNNMVNFFMVAMSDNHLKYLVVSYVIIKIFKSVSESQKNNAIAKCKKTTEIYLNKALFMEIKSELFNNFTNAFSIFDRFAVISKNINDILSIFSEGIAPVIINIIFSITISVILFYNNQFRDQSLYQYMKIVMYIVICLIIIALIVIISHYLSTNNNLKFKNTYKNEIAFNRKSNISETLPNIFSKSYKLFEDFTIEALYIIFIGILIPVVLISKINGSQVNEYSIKSSSVYLVLCTFFLWNNANKFKLLFAYIAKHQENKYLSSDFVHFAKTKLAIEPSSLSIVNFPLERENYNLDNNTVVFTGGTINQIYGSFGKTTFVKKILGLTKLNNNQEIIVTDKQDNKNTINPQFTNIAPVSIYINPDEISDITIRDFFKCEDVDITDREIFSLLSQSCVLDSLEKYNHILSTNINILSDHERILLCFSKIFMKNKNIFIAEISDSTLKTLSNRERLLFINTIKNRFPIIVLLSSSKLDFADNIYSIKYVKE